MPARARSDARLVTALCVVGHAGAVQAICGSALARARVGSPQSTRSIWRRRQVLSVRFGDQMRTASSL